MRRSAHSRLLATLLAPAVLTVACTGDDDGGGGDGGDDEAIEFSDDSSPGASASVSVDGDTVLAIVGDAGELNDDTLAVAALVGSADPAAVFTVGDNEYVSEGRTVDAYEESVGRVYGRWLDDGTFFPIPGDHDYGDRCGDPDAPADLDAYLEYFDLPAGPEDETYYDVRIDDVHVFALDSMPECHRDGGARLARQRAWLAETATASDAALKIVLLHNPPHSSGISHGSVEELRWDFAGWGVDLVVSGHDHIYERSTHAGVPYVVNGLGGVEAHEIGDLIEGSEVLYGDAFGALFVTVTGTIAEAAFVTVDGEEIDRFPLGAGTAGDADSRAEALRTHRPCSRQRVPGSGSSRARAGSSSVTSRSAPTRAGAPTSTASRPKRSANRSTGSRTSDGSTSATHRCAPPPRAGSISPSSEAVTAWSRTTSTATSTTPGSTSPPTTNSTSIERSQRPLPSGAC